MYVVLEKKILMKASKNTHAIPLLFSTFLVFNLSYTTGANAYYQFFEHLLLQTRPSKKQNISKLFLRLGL